MPKLHGDGTQDVIDILDRMGEKTLGATKHMCYEGAKVVADALRKAIAADGSLSEHEKSALLKGIGVSTITNDAGGTSVAVSFDGYSDNSKFPIPFLGRIITKGARPGSAAAIATETESGTSKRKKNPIVRRTANACKSRAQEAMKAALLEMI